LEKLKFSDKLQTFSGKHGATGITNTEYKFLGVDLKQAINSLGQPLQK